MKLYEIQQQLNALLEEAWQNAAENEGAIDEGLSEAIDLLEIKRSEKLANIAKVILTLNAEAEAYKKHKQKFAAMEKSAMNRVKWLKNYIDATLQDGEKIKTDEVQIATRNSEAVEITDVNKVPAIYLVAEPKPIKSAIKKAIKAGEEVPGAEIVVNRSIQIK